MRGAAASCCFLRCAGARRAPLSPPSLLVRLNAEFNAGLIHYLPSWLYAERANAVNGVTSNIDSGEGGSNVAAATNAAPSAATAVSAAPPAEEGSYVDLLQVCPAQAPLRLRLLLL